LQVRNLALNTLEGELITLFDEVGEVLDVKIIRDRLSGDSRGYAFVTMSALSEADTAVSRLNDREFHGLRLMVSLAQARTVHGRSGESLPRSHGG
jgi:RNA recognition motif-containing protein